MRVRQDKNREKSAVYRRVNEHFEPISNAVWCQLRGFTTASNKPVLRIVIPVLFEVPAQDMTEFTNLLFFYVSTLSTTTDIAMTF